MDLLTAAEKAEIHREIYVAIIQGATRERGAQKALAERAGITPEYLSYLLALDRDPTKESVMRRRASLEVARRIADALPAPEAKRQEAFEHMAEARGQAQRMHRVLARDIGDLEQMVWEVRVLSHQATHTPDAALARRSYRAAVQSGSLLAQHMSVRGWPIDYVELCLCLHDALCVLDGPAAALQYARFGHIVLDWVDPARYRGNEDRVREMGINVVRAVGVAYNNLGVPGEAARHFKAAQQLSTLSSRPVDWLGHVCRDRLSALAKLPRLRLSEAEGLAYQALEKMGGQNQDLVPLLLRAKLGECYLAFDSPRDYAGPFLDALIEDTERSTALGPLHKAIIYRTYARLCRKRGDSVGLAGWVERALGVAEEAGLVHQVRGIREDFPAEVAVISGGQTPWEPQTPAPAPEG